MRRQSAPGGLVVVSGLAVALLVCLRAPAADYAPHMKQLRGRIPAEGFTVVIQPPFVVISDEPAEQVKRRAERTIKWAVDLLKKEYFRKDPAQIIDIWLFKDAESYRKHTKKIIGREPGTPFGFYSPQHHALVMNIATGGGTLVHEIVHPFMAANFPACPAWFNEGLGSLYEQCCQRQGHIRGLTNWRLAGLQRAIRAGQVLSFKQLTSTTSGQFYNEQASRTPKQAPPSRDTKHLGPSRPDKA